MKKVILILFIMFALNVNAQSVCCDYTECETIWMPTWNNPFNTVTICSEGDVCHPIDCDEIK